MIHISPQKTPKKFECTPCDFSTSNKKDYNRHLDTAKHKMIHNDTLLAPTPNNLYECVCGNAYMQRSNLYRHRKKCNIANKKPNTELDVKENVGHEVIKTLLEQNKELHSTIINMSKNQNTTTTNSHNTTTNSHNKAFNLNVYLNETCKNAMNLSDFVENVVPTLEDLENVGRDGYSDGVSKIISTQMRQVEKNLQPIHCADGKREIFYIKENDTWNKEADEKPLLINAIKKITQKNIRNILKWRDKHPGCDESDSNKNDLYLKIIMNSMMGGTEEETANNISKIIRNISKYTLIDKQIIV